MKSFFRCVAVAALLFTATILHAQIPFSSADLAAIEATTPTAADALPFIGTFYSAANPQLPPEPCNVLGWAGWDLGDLNGIEIYLLDDLSGAGSGGGSYAMDDSDIPPGGGDEGNYSFTNTYAGFPTNGLWLQITNISNDAVYANINGTTDYVYEIYSSTNLPVAALAVSNWDIETEVFPGINTNSMPFNVPMNGRNPLFLWGRDWTGITSNGNTVPEWWLWEYFDTVDLIDTNLDSLGQNTLLYDFENKIDPNVVLFSLEFTNDYFYANPVSGSVSVQAGEPFYEAVLVNDPNFNDAVWQPLTSTNLAIDLGSTNGTYTVLVGLRGFPTNATATWQGAQVSLNLTPLVLTVTNPVDSVVSQSLIQVQGYAGRPLASLSFDVSNTAGIFTNQTGYVISQYYDPNLQMITTNYFQCYDVKMAAGPNVVTLHTTDTEGNTGSASESLEYSPGTNPPVLTVLWPPNGTLISGASFTLQGQVDDDTATVTAQITDTNGDINTVQGLVERNGTVWVSNLPMSPGTNILTLAATNAAGYSMTTNLTLVQSPVIVTMSPLSQLNQSSVSVTGTISDQSYDVYVNSTEAYYLDTNGDWEADNVSVSPTGTATFNVQVYSGDPVLGGTENFNQDQPPMVVLKDYSYSDAEPFNTSYAHQTSSTTYQWDYQSGGEYNFLQVGVGITEANQWEPTDYIENYGIAPDTTNDWFVFTPAWETASWSDPGNDQADIMLTPSGKAIPRAEVLWLIEAQVTNELTGLQEPASEVQFTSQLPGTAAVDVTNAGNLVWTAALVSCPAGATPTVTPIGKNISYNSVSIAANVTLQIVDKNNNGNKLSGQTNTVIVGQQMNLGCELSVTNAAAWNAMLTNFQWTVPGDAISNYVVAPDTSSATVATNFPTTNSNVQFYWVDGATNRALQCSATIGSAVVTGQAVFNVVTPTARILTTTTAIALGIRRGGADFGICFGTNTGLPGILFAPTILMPEGNYNYGNTNYTPQWVQITKLPTMDSRTFQLGDNTSNLGQSATHFLLDTSYPYGFDTNLPYPQTSDSPFFASDQPDEISASYTNYFQIWLMFQPTNGQWVPLRTVSWYISASATNSNPSWTLLDSSCSTNPPDANPVGQFPIRNGNFTNLPVNIN